MNNKIKFWHDLKSGRFASMVRESSKGQKLSNSQEAYNVLKPLFSKTDDVEQAYFIFLDSQNQIFSIERLFSGSLSASSIYPREIVKRLIARKSGAFVMAHNHPSGNVQPSPEDLSITMRIAIATGAMDVSFHDHIIIGDGYYSMADAGFMKKISNKLDEMTKLSFRHQLFTSQGGLLVP